jgi:hypothetical protein
MSDIVVMCLYILETAMDPPAATKQLAPVGFYE